MDKPEEKGRIDTRPAQAERGAPHWVVIRMARAGKEVPIEDKRSWRMLYRHITEAGASEEAARLAAIHKGTRFAIYASGPSFKVEKVASPIPSGKVPAP